MSHTLALDSLLQNRYRIRRKLGQGGFGAVYLAADIRLNNHLVAAKENFDNSKEAQTQFQIEAHLLATLQHNGLPRVSDFFVEPSSGRQYLIMDYVEGDDLAVIVQRTGRLNETQALPWIDQVCDALAYLHTQQPPIIHRDIKPPNIRIRRDQRAILVDFGIAKIFDPKQGTAMGARAVSAGYSPLEQYGNATTDARSDVYALGATMYFLFTGHAPPEATELAAQDKTLTPPRQINPHLAPHVENAILKAMHLDARHRYNSADELRRALHAPKAIHQPAPFVPPPPIVQAQPIPQISGTIRCARCGQMNRKTARVCRQCGKPLRGVQKLDAVMPPHDTPASHAAPPKPFFSPEPAPTPKKSARGSKQAAPKKLAPQKPMHRMKRILRIVVFVFLGLIALVIAGFLWIVYL
ncbi:MAG: hypothetical protein B6D41_22150 [Chloroflexi bacterium UTCFX4]|jgi:serine/threonine-protein kinase|nr:MAG: hypothetical protein B6D41_22150 [Chloroflexi bacterium UTCFX4]